VENAADIAAVEGIDGLFIGPGDLGLRLGQQEGAPGLDECIGRVAEAASRHGKAWGIAGGGAEDWSRWRQAGAQMLIGAGDFALTGVLAQAQREFDSVLGAR